MEWCPTEQLFVMLCLVCIQKSVLWTMRKSYNNLQTVCSSMSRSHLPIPAKHFSNTHLQNLSTFCPHKWLHKQIKSSSSWETSIKCKSSNTILHLYPNKGATSSQRQSKLSYKYARPMLPGKVAKSTQNISKASKPLMSSSKNGSSLHNCIQNGGKKFQEPWRLTWG